MPKGGPDQRAPKGSLRGKSWLPRFALVTLVVLLAVDLPSTDVDANTPSKPSDGKAGDIEDTHQRLARIYARLGIKREAPKERQTPRGCGGGDLRSQPRSAPPPLLPPSLGYVLIGVVLLAMLLPILLAFRGRGGAINASSAEEPDEEDGAQALAYEPWDTSFAGCRRLLAAGRLAEAFAALHRLTLLSMQRADTLVLDTTSTNWDYVRRLVRHPADHSLLSQVTIAAESAVLGKHPPDATCFEELERLLRQRMEGE